MNRRETLKLMALCAAAPGPGPTPGAGRRATFESDWHDWGDMRWAGPACWGNRLQDWHVVSGTLECRTRAANRTLHCLTHQATSPDYVTTVVMNRPAGVGAPDARFGFRLGAKGPFADYRSAAVRGTGLDVGVTGHGAVFIGDDLSAPLVNTTAPVRLEAHVASDQLTVSVRPLDDDEPVAQVVRVGIGAEVLGNVALLSHVPGPAPGTAAAFNRWTVHGDGITAHPAGSFGPIMFTQYTTQGGVLRLTAQLAPVETLAHPRPILEFRNGNTWIPAATAAVDPLARTARFRVDGWDAGEPRAFRVRVPLSVGGTERQFTYEGTIAREPSADEPLKVAVFSCNADHGFPDNEVVRHVTWHAPDVAVFLGDQFYEGTGGFGIQRDSVEEASLDMLAKWYMFGWSYRDIFRHIPSACIPDDHDVYHGNIWGEDGKVAPTEEGWGAVAQDQGGYKMPPVWVNAVQRCQTSHLPDPYDPTPVQQGIGVYYCRWDYGAASFAILEDRKFKSAPGNVLPAEAQIRNGWIQNPDFDIRQHRDIDAELLGARQMHFLRDWASDYGTPGARMKVVLSQTNFAAVHTIPEDATSGAVLPSLPMPAPGEYVPGDKLAVDMDSNGWPQNRRDETLRVLRACAAFHIAGDQHLATVVRHGIDAFDDAVYTFTGPALNNIWPRRWWPAPSLKQRAVDAPGEYTGSFFDGFGNRITVFASANPRDTGLQPSIIRDRVTGYGMVTLDPTAGTVRIECWPRYADPREGDDGQYEGWPIVVQPEAP